MILGTELKKSGHLDHTLQSYGQMHIFQYIPAKVGCLWNPTKHITSQQKSVSWRICIRLHLASFSPPPKCFLFLSDNVIFRGLMLSLDHFVPENPENQLQNCVSESSLPPWQASALWTARTTRRTRLGRRLTWPLARFFQNLQKWSKSVQKCPRVVQIHFSSVFDRYPSFGSHLNRFEHFWKNRLRVMSASSLVLSSLLSLLSTVHLPTRESWRV